LSPDTAAAVSNTSDLSISSSAAGRPGSGGGGGTDWDAGARDKGISARQALA
jgi:hypothetical protein